MLDQGVYTLSEVSRYTGVPFSTIRDWFLPHPQGRHSPVFESDWPRVGDDYAVSFLNLIEAYVASFFRKKGMKPNHIRRAHSILQERWNTKHPFARRDLRTDGKRIIIQSTGDPQLVEAISKQEVFEYVKPHLREINYELISKLAGEWRIGTGVVINPKIGFGKPVIKNTGVSTLVVAQQYQANGRNAALVARLFDIPEKGVLDAFRFEKRLKRIAA